MRGSTPSLPTTAALPLPRALYVAATALAAAMLDVAGDYQRAIEAAHEHWLRPRRADRAVSGARALRLLDEAYLVASMSGAPARAGLWRRACALLGHEGALAGGRDALPGSPAAEAALHFKRLAAFAALQPESLSARELAWAHDFLERTALAAEIACEPVHPASAAFWIDLSQDAAPVAAVRCAPPASERLLYFSAYSVAREIGPALDALKTAAPSDAEPFEPGEQGLPVGLTSVEAISLLERMRERWMAPPSRLQPRRLRQYSIQVCCGLRAIWDASRGTADPASIAEWMVYNESSGGYAIMSVSGVAGTMSAGMPLALRRDATQPWSVSIVRWVRSDDAEQVEVGLQVISTGCTAVSVAFRGGDVRSTTRALLLPPMPRLRSNQALLAPAGSYTSRRLDLVRADDHVYVAQGRILSLDMQTASVEVLQFDIDVYPR